MTPDFKVGDWRVSPNQSHLQSGAKQAHLEPKVMDLLVYLSKHSDEVLSKEKLIQAVWPDAFVGDDVLTSAIWKLRQAMDDDPGNPAYIRTFSRRGYQVVAKVEFLEEEAPGSPGPTAGQEILPYPGLSSFTAAQAEFFFGREVEVEAIWEKLQRSRLTGLIGPSGVGKSSLLRAGLAPSAPAGWAVIVATPGTQPLLGLAQAFSEEFSGDPRAARQLLRFQEPGLLLSLVSRWRGRHRDALIVVDQFEELFTLNPPENQEQFAGLLGRLVDEADIHLLLSMRDDFLFQCHGLDGLEPIFSANLTPIGPPVGAALRRALVQPAEKCGYGFGDEALVEEMMEAVAGERGALPLLAFTCAELWQRRDRERKLLTRDAYESIGGVEGALASHAEGTLDRIGSRRIPVVRELFRNLVTARGTRSVMSRRELLSVFGNEQQVEAAETLDGLVDARLLVSYGHPSVDRDEDQEDRIEIVHESLLTHWPRLVRWQTQETEGAQLRDELRQAARMWDQHKRSEDLLWSGTAVREYELWRERYPGRMTELEEEFGQAMTRRARYQSRKKRLLLTAGLVLSIVAVIVTTALWRLAESEKMRAEAAHLMALAQSEAESDPTASVAYATRSLELADTKVARLFVSDVLSQGPIAFTRETETDAGPIFSPDGKSLVVAGHAGFYEIWHSGRSDSNRLDGWRDFPAETGFSADGRYLWVREPVGEQSEYKIWRFPDLTMVKQFKLNRQSHRHNLPRVHPDGIPSFSRIGETSQARVRLIPFEGDTSEESLIVPWDAEGIQSFYFGAESTLMVRLVGSELFLESVDQDRPASPRKFGQIQDGPRRLGFLPDGTRFATLDGSKQFNIWSLDQAGTAPLRTFQYPFEILWNEWAFDQEGRWLAAATSADGVAAVWDLARPVSAGPQILCRGQRNTSWVAVQPQGDWVAVGDKRAISLWPLRNSYPSIIFRQSPLFSGLAVDPKGRFVAASDMEGESKLRLWSLESTGEDRPRILFSTGGLLEQVAFSPDGERVAVSKWNGTVFVVSVSEGSVEEFTGFQSRIHTLAFDETGRKLAAAGGLGKPEEALIRVWDLDTKEAVVLDSGDGTVPARLQFGLDGRLFSSGWASNTGTGGPGGLRMWKVDDGTFQLLFPSAAARLSPDGRRFLVDPLGDDSGMSSDLIVYDLETGKSRSLPAFGQDTFGLAWHPSGEAVLTVSRDGGLIQVGRLTGEPPHRLAGHEGFVFAEFHPNGQWIISAGEDGTLRLWPMPDLSKPPFHTLPYGELMARLKGMTNYRVFEDRSSPTGYGIEYGEFPDWEKGAPEW